MEKYIEINGLLGKQLAIVRIPKKRFNNDGCLIAETLNPNGTTTCEVIAPNDSRLTAQTTLPSRQIPRT